MGRVCAVVCILEFGCYGCCIDAEECHCNFDNLINKSITVSININNYLGIFARFWQPSFNFDGI